MRNCDTTPWWEKDWTLEDFRFLAVPGEAPDPFAETLGGLAHEIVAALGRVDAGTAGLFAIVAVIRLGLAMEMRRIGGVQWLSVARRVGKTPLDYRGSRKVAERAALLWSNCVSFCTGCPVIRR